MKIERHGFDGAQVELEAPELALLSDIVGQTLGYQESFSGPLDQEVADLLDSLYSGINAALSQISAEDELRSGPFLQGEPVERIFDQSGSKVTASTPGIVIADHREDREHDYPWTTVQFGDGLIADVPTHHLRRSK